MWTQPCAVDRGKKMTIMGKWCCGWVAVIWPSQVIWPSVLWLVLPARSLHAEMEIRNKPSDMQTTARKKRRVTLTVFFGGDWRVQVKHWIDTWILLTFGPDVFQGNTCKLSLPVLCQLAGSHFVWWLAATILRGHWKNFGQSNDLGGMGTMTWLYTCHSATITYYVCCRCVLFSSAKRLLTFLPLMKKWCGSQCLGTFMPKLSDDSCTAW